MGYYDYYDDYSYYNNSSYIDPAEEGLWWLLMIMLVFVALFALAGYLTKAFGMYNMAKKQNVPNPWLAFIPFASNYLMGDLAGDAIPVGKKTMRNPALWMLLVPIISSVAICVVYFSLVIFGALAGAVLASTGMIGFFVGVMVVLVLLYVVVVLAVSAVLYVVQSLVCFNIYKKYTDDSMSLVHTILGLLIPLYINIYFLILGNRYPKDYVAAPVVEEEPPYEGNSF